MVLRAEIHTWAPVGYCTEPHDSSPEGPKEEANPRQSINDYFSQIPSHVVECICFSPPNFLFCPHKLNVFKGSVSTTFSFLVGISKRKQQVIKSSLSFCCHQILSPLAGTPPMPWGWPASYANSTRPLMRSWKSIACFQLDTHGPFSTLRQTAFPCGVPNRERLVIGYPMEWGNAPFS